MRTIEQFYDNMYEQSAFARSESIEMHECESCKGMGYTPLSDCCGAEIIDGICQDIECLNPCQEDKEKCDDCNGEGEVEV